jgi:hypothetical protein
LPHEPFGRCHQVLPRRVRRAGSVKGASQKAQGKSERQLHVRSAARRPQPRFAVTQVVQNRGHVVVHEMDQPGKDLPVARVPEENRDVGE